MEMTDNRSADISTERERVGEHARLVHVQHVGIGERSSRSIVPAMQTKQRGLVPAVDEVARLVVDADHVPAALREAACGGELEQLEAAGSLEGPRHEADRSRALAGASGASEGAIEEQLL
jgi:hypothetical protein